MRKMLLDGDIAVIDGEEYTLEELKEALLNQYRFNNITNFLRTECQKSGDSK